MATDALHGSAGHISMKGIGEARGGREIASSVPYSMPDAACFVAVGCGVERPQGGGGYDHPNKVQQRKAQTEIFITPGAIVTLLVSSTL